MKIIFTLCCCLLFLSATAGNTINGMINQKEGTIQVLIRNSPFDDNVALLTESMITDGLFTLHFDLPYDTEIIFSVNDLTVAKQIESGSEWEIELQIIALSKPDYFGNTQKLELTRLESNSSDESRILKIKNDIKTILEDNRKGNGKIGKNYVPALESYLIELVNQSDPSEFKSKLSTSDVFTSAFYTVRRNKSNPELEAYFADNFDFSFNGLEAVNHLYARAIQIEFFTKAIGKSNYFDFILKETTKIEDEKIRNAAISILITSAIGRKWTDQVETMNKLTSLIESCKYPALKTWLEEFSELHSNALIGSQLQDFEMEKPDGGRIRFSDYKGSYLLIDFWATWCGLCVKNMKKLPAIKEKKSNLEILCITTEKDTDKVRRFIDRNGYQNSLDFGIAGNEMEIDSYFNKRAIPLYFLISPDGIILEKAVTDPIPMLEKYLGD